jgi:oligogalacturonide lyase
MIKTIRHAVFFCHGLFLAAWLVQDSALHAQETTTNAAPSAATLAQSTANEPPTDWIDPVTGHRIIRLSHEPGTSSLYFHQNAYTDDKLFVTLARGQQSRGAVQPTDVSKSVADNSPSRRNSADRPITLATIDLSTLGVSPPKIDEVASGPDRGMVVGRKTGDVYYVRSQTVDGAPSDMIYATNLNTHETHEIGRLPFRIASGLAINADETLLGGSFVVDSTDAQAQPVGGNPSSKNDANPSDQKSASRPMETPQDRNIATRFAAHLPMKLFTINIHTGEVQTFHPSTDWLNHVQFSPSDPQLMMFCHEGPWHEVDRIWTIRPGSDDAQLMHQRTMPYEIAGHEFFGSGGTIWYDLQTPRSEKFWLASVNPNTGERLWYPLNRSEWSVHYNVSHNEKLFAGDGGGPNSVANRGPLPEGRRLDTPGNGQWIYLFTPTAGDPESKQVGDATVKVGKFEVEKLVDLSKHNYQLEPNVTFTPDDKWIVFRANMHGPTHTYAVEIAKPH